MRALIVDDSNTMRKILASIMEQEGFDVTEAEDGQQALERLRELGDADVMLLDWNMPKMNGLETLKAVRADASYNNLRILMVTTESEMESLVQALEAGANDYIMKPFTKESVVEKLRILGFTTGKGAP